MISYQYLVDLFSGILTKSRAIQGRFHVSHRYGAQEINSDQLGEVIREINPSTKYPLALMVGPTNIGFLWKSDGWQKYHVIMCFVQTSYYNEKGIRQPNLNSKTSTHTVYQDWQDMQRCAKAFMEQLGVLQRVEGARFRLPKTLSLINTISTIGTDRASGVKLHFDIELFNNCELEDYDEYLTDLPEAIDSHAEHQL